MLIRFPFSILFPLPWHIFPFWLTFVQCFNFCQFFWLLSAPNRIAYFHNNLDGLIIIRTSKSVIIPDYCLWLGFLGRLLVIFFFIATVTTFRFLHIPTGTVLVTISLLVGLCALLGYVGVPFSTHILDLAWVEASFEFLAVYYIEEWAIGVPVSSASAPATPTTALPSTAMALSTHINCWYPSPVDPESLVLVALCDSEGLSDLGFHIGYSTKPFPKLVILDFCLVLRDVSLILDLNPINRSLHHFLLSYLVVILCYWRKFCLQACGILCKLECVLVIVLQALLWVQRNSLVNYYDALVLRVGFFILLDQRHTCWPDVFVCSKSLIQLYDVVLIHHF